MGKRIPQSQHNFLSGEWSPLLYSRTDRDQYFSALKTATNCFVDKRGPIKKRPGTNYLNDVHDEDYRPRFIEFVNTSGEYYSLEFGENYVRYYKNGARLSATTTTTYDATEVEQLSVAYYNDVIYIACPGVNLRAITYTNDTTWSIADVSWAAAPTTTQPDFVFIFQQRLGVVDADSNLIEFSENGDLDDFTTGVNDDDGFNIAPAFSGTEPIKWLAVTNSIVAGTNSYEMTIEGTRNNSAITPTNVSINKRETKGSNSNRTAVYDTEVMYIGPDGKSVYTFFYNYEIDSYDSVELSIDAEHLFTSQIKDLKYSRLNRRIYVVLDGGNILTGTYRREARTIAWTKLAFDGTVESVSISQNSSGVENVYIAIKRSIDGSDARYIELFETGDGSSVDDAFTDSSLSTSTTDTGTWYPVSKYDGGTAVQSEGIANLTVSVGFTRITLDSAITGSWLVDGDTIVITGATGSGARLAATNAVHTVMSQNSTTEIDLYTDLSSLAGSVSAGSATCHFASGSSTTLINATSHGLSTGDVIRINSPGSLDSGLTDVYTGQHTITKIDNDFFTIPVGDINTNTANFGSYTANWNVRLTVFSGLSHLEGKTIQVRADGSNIGNHTVASGSVTLSQPGFELTAGISYTMELETLPPEAGSPLRSSLTNKGRWADIRLNLYSSSVPEVLGRQSNWRQFSDNLDSQLPLYSGVVKYGSSDQKTMPTVSITDTNPYPVIITGIFGFIEVGDQ